MKILRTLVLLTLIAAATNAVALEQEGGIHFIVGAPAGDFGETVEDPGFGLDVHYGVRPIPSLTFGAGMDFMIYGSESTRIEMPLVEDFDLTTTNNLASGFLFAQWRPFSGPVQPYAEARLGLRYLWTESKLEDKDWYDDEEVARETNYDDFANYWGGGGGLLIRLHEGDETRNSPSVFLDFKVNFLKGAKAEYLSEGDITVVNDTPVFQVSESETDLTVYELGVVLTF
jgi:hypothetical protein